MTIATMEDSRFTEEQIIQDKVARRSGANQPTLTDLLSHMRKYGPDGVVESAIHLQESQYDKLAKAAKKMRYNKRARKWETV